MELKRRLIEVLVAGVRIDTVETCGVRQAEITVPYRFSQPEQPMPVLLPQAYGAGSVVGIPGELFTIGHHIRRQHLALKLFQKDVAERIGVDITSVFNWEAGTNSPEIQYMPAIIGFLGYNLLPEGRTWGTQLVPHRTALGLTQKEAARELGVDAGTLARWERGEREPEGVFLDRVRRFLTESGTAQTDARRAAVS